jgi:hypothetical protein
MIVTYTDISVIEKLQNYLIEEFEMKNLGPLKYFFGVE